jgi:hypothetical protein
MTVHALRKFACSALMSDSANSAEVEKYVGHSNVTVFYNQYVFLDVGHKLELTERITGNFGNIAWKGEVSRSSEHPKSPLFQGPANLGRKEILGLF